MAPKKDKIQTDSAKDMQDRVDRRTKGESAADVYGSLLRGESTVQGEVKAGAQRQREQQQIQARNEAEAEAIKAGVDVNRNAGTTPVEMPTRSMDAEPMNTTPVESVPMQTDQSANLQALTGGSVAPQPAPVEEFGQTPVDASNAIAGAGGQATYGPQQLQPPTAKGGGVKDDLWTTAAPMVEKAEEIKGPGFKENALAMLGALFPFIGTPLMEPLRKATADYNKKTGKDAELTKLFLGELKDDPANAKRLSRVPRFRDALQREMGMSGEEIMELDDSIKSSSQYDFNKFVEMVKNPNLVPTDVIETPWGDFVPRSEFKAGKEGSYTIFNPLTNKVEINYGYLQEQQDKIYERAIKNGMSEIDATVLSMAANKGEPVYTNNTMGNGVLALTNRYTGDTKQVKFADAVKEKIKMEIAKDVAGVPTAMFFYKEGFLPKSIDDITVINFSSIKVGNQTLREVIMGMPPEEIKSGGWMDTLRSMFGGVEITDHTTVGDQTSAQPVSTPRQAANNAQAQPISPPPAGRAQGSAPAPVASDTQELEKAKTFADQVF